MDLEFRRATEADMDALIELEKTAAGTRLYSATTTPEEAREYLQNTKTYLIYKDGELIGDVAYDLKAPDHAHIDGLMVRPDHQGQGIGKAAMEYVLAELKDVPTIDLFTHPENERAIRLYESLGFKRGETIENAFGDGEPRVVMTLAR